MQVLALHPDVIVARSAAWQTTCTAMHCDDECFVVDSPLFPDELDALPSVLAQAGWSLSGLLCTHGDWDHLLGRLAFPQAALGCAESTAARLTGEPGAAQRKLRGFDEEHYVERAPLQLGQLQALAAPGRLELGERELELIPTAGHTEDGMAIWAPWASVLIAGDYCSPLEIPWLSESGDRDSYLATLERLRPYAERAQWLIPGHGAPLERERALAILREDAAYLQALPDPDAPLPLARRGRQARKIHAENLARMEP